jgi:hypothetical protein
VLRGLLRNGNVHSPTPRHPKRPVGSHPHCGRSRGYLSAQPRDALRLASSPGRGDPAACARPRDQRREGSTAGIPLLHPWANRLAEPRYSTAGRDVELDPSSPLLHFDEHGLPMHGVPWSRLTWEVTENRQDSLVAQLDWTQGELLAVFPYRHQMELTATPRPRWPHLRDDAERQHGRPGASELRLSSLCPHLGIEIFAPNAENGPGRASIHSLKDR